MAIDKQLGTEDNPNVRVQGSAVEIPLDTTREDQIREAAEILIENENLFIDEEIQGAQPQEMDFNSNLVDFLGEDILQSISNDLLSSIKSDKQSSGS